jgi:hypothetical protein
MARKLLIAIWRYVIPKLADPDSSCVNSGGTSNAKNVRWSNEIWAQRSSADVGKDESRFPQFGISSGIIPEGAQIAAQEITVGNISPPVVREA